MDGRVQDVMLDDAVTMQLEVETLIGAEVPPRSDHRPPDRIEVETRHDPEPGVMSTAPARSLAPRPDAGTEHVPIGVLALDHLLDRLARTSHMLDVPLAAAAHELVTCRAFVPYGYQSFHDFTRETLDRSSRWVRDLAVLHVVLGRFPELGRALAGVDGQASIGRQKAIANARVATASGPGTTPAGPGPSSIGPWIERARALPYPALLEELRTARTQISSKPAADTAPTAAASPIEPT